MNHIKYLLQTEVERFFSVIASKRDRALFGLVYCYGLRVSEVAQLQLGDIDMAHERIYLRRVKSGYGGERPLMADIRTALQDYLAIRIPSGNALFTSRQGALGIRRIQQLFKHYARCAGLGSQYSIHCLRHSIATHLLEAGLDIAYVQDHLGHARIQSTKIYAQITDRRRLEAFRMMEESPDIVKL